LHNLSGTLSSDYAVSDIIYTVLVWWITIENSYCHTSCIVPLHVKWSKSVISQVGADVAVNGCSEVSEWRRRCHTFIAQNVSFG